MSAQTSLEVMDRPETQVATVHTVTPLDMLDRALSQGAGLEVVEKLMDLQDRWERNNARKAFDQAISAAKSEIPPIVKNASVGYENKDGSFTGYKHETLDGIAKVVDPILSDHGLSYRFRSQQNGGMLSVTCIVAHRDGYYEETTLSGPPDQSGKKNAYQAVGSAATYLQRYTLKLALGLSAGKDDDAQAATPRQEDRAAPQTETKKTSKDTEARAVFTLHQASIRQATSRDGLRQAWQAACADKDRIPSDWQNDLVKEKNEKLAEITKAEEAEKPAEDFPFNDEAAPTEAEEFLQMLAAEMGQAEDLDTLDEIWNARNPLETLDFPPDHERAQNIYDFNRQRLGRP